jgi:hypothetical protein
MNPLAILTIVLCTALLTGLGRYWTLSRGQLRGSGLREPGTSAVPRSPEAEEEARRLRRSPPPPKVGPAYEPRRAAS